MHETLVLKNVIPGHSPLVLRNVVLDFNGTPACNGRLIRGIATPPPRLQRILAVEADNGHLRRRPTGTSKNRGPVHGRPGRP